MCVIKNQNKIRYIFWQKFQYYEGDNKWTKQHQHRPMRWQKRRLNKILLIFPHFVISSHMSHRVAAHRLRNNAPYVCSFHVEITSIYSAHILLYQVLYTCFHNSASRITVSFLVCYPTMKTTKQQSSKQCVAYEYTIHSRNIILHKEAKKLYGSNILTINTQKTW